MMAGVVEKDAEEEYQSDPEEAKLSLKMRRREASDDDDEDEEQEKSPRRINSDDDDSEEGLGAASEYSEDENEAQYAEEDLVDQSVVEADEEEEDVVVKQVFEELHSGRDDGSDYVVKEKEEIEPCAVPTTGAFYMHDDRFRDSAYRGRGRNRPRFGGRMLWQSKDNWKWGHDKFEELTMEESHYEEGRRTSRGHFRGRGRARGAERGTSCGRRPKVYTNNYNQTTSNSQNNQSNASKNFWGRGPSRYRPSSKQSFDAPRWNIQSGKSVEKVSHNSTGKASLPESNNGSTSAKLSFVSSLNYASPPFYPSNSSTKESLVTHKRELQTGSSHHLIHETSAAAQSSLNTLHREIESSSETGKLKSAMVAKGKGNLQGPGRGSVLYGGGSQVMGARGNMSSGHSDQNLSATSSYLPVMHFGSRKPGGRGAPAVGMAFPGYVTQTQLGLSSSDMTWLPALAGAAGAFGTSYCSPNFSLDGIYHARPSGGQLSSLTTALSKEDSTSKNHVRKPQEKNELTDDNSGQRQKNTRRYTEMKFDK